MDPVSKNKSIWKYSSQWEEELLLLKSIIDKTEVTETTKWGGPVYVYEKKNVLGIGGFKDYFTIWFFNLSKHSPWFQPRGHNTLFRGFNDGYTIPIP